MRFVTVSWSGIRLMGLALHGVHHPGQLPGRAVLLKDSATRIAHRRLAFISGWRGRTQGARTREISVESSQIPIPAVNAGGSAQVDFIISPAFRTSARPLKY